MVILRHFTEQDASFVCEGLYPDLTIDEVVTMIREWNSGVHCGRYFEMFAVLSDDTIVGYASLTEHSQSTVSAGIEILSSERNKGFGAQALAALIDAASGKGYRIMLDQVRTDNQASIRLHEKMGFESDGYTYRNRNNNEIILYIKPL
ncbi:MAG: GNAT family N-acetyltransferase [Clostridia bacterium]|nr:GNAT family N-acetyltransferase [Clostridia bacterium]